MKNPDDASGLLASPTIPAVCRDCRFQAGKFNTAST